MNSTWSRDLSTEILLRDVFLNGGFCDIGSTSWTIRRDETDRLICETIDFSFVKDCVNSHQMSLDKKKMTVCIDKGKQDMVIRRSFVTTIHINPDKPFARALLVDFSESMTPPKPCRQLAIISVSSNVSIPFFRFYFAYQGHDYDRLCYSVNSPSYRCLFNGIRFSFHNCEFLVYDYTQTGKQPDHNLVVEALNTIDHKEFKAAVRTILATIGFITGSYCFGSFWTFNATTHEFISYCDSMSKGGTATYRMFSLNPYDYFAEADKASGIDVGIEDQLNPVTRSQIEKLLNLLDDRMFSLLFYVFQELTLNGASLSASTRLPIYATCLEMCRNWWKTSENASGRHTSTLLYSAEERKDIRRKFDEILNNEYGERPDTAICKKRIPNLFQSANQDALAEAFTDVGIKLSEEEKDSLGLRNPLLHGTDVIQTQFDEDNASAYMDEIESKYFVYHALIWRFIMRAIGYHGVYIDVARLNKLFRSSQSNDSRPLTKEI